MANQDRGTILRLDLRTVIAVVGVLVGVSGGFFALRRYQSEQPNLFVNLNTASLVVSGLGVAALPEALAEIEEKYGEITAHCLADLRTEALALDAEADDFESRLRNFRAHLQVTLMAFDEKRGGWARESIDSDGKTIFWPDGIQLSFAHENIRTYFPTALVDDVGRLRDKPGEELLARIRDAAYALHNPSEPRPGLRRELASRLRQVRTSVDNCLKDQDRKVQVEITVQNRSRLPNVVLRPALLRIFKDKRQFVNLRLTLPKPALLEPYSAHSLILESRRVEALAEDDREFVQRAFEQEYDCLVVVQDLHRSFWDAVGSFAEVKHESFRTLIAECDKRFEHIGPH